MRDAHGHATWAPRIGLYWKHIGRCWERVRDTATRNEGGSETSGDILQTLPHWSMTQAVGLICPVLTVVLRTRPEVCAPRDTSLTAHDHLAHHDLIAVFH